MTEWAMLPEAGMNQVPPVDSTGINLARSLRIQSLVMVLLAFALLLVSPVAAYSSLFGGLAVWLPVFEWVPTWCRVTHANVVLMPMLMAFTH